MENDENLICIGFMFDGSQRKTEKTFLFLDNIHVKVSCIAENPGDLQSGHYIWPASQALSEYLVEYIDQYPNGDVLEVGTGCGLAGLVATYLRPNVRVLLTDHDPGIIESLRLTIQQQEFDTRKCSAHTLRWGPIGENDIQWMSKENGTVEGRVSLVLGADVIYSYDGIEDLFYTVDRVLDRDCGVFLLAMSFPLSPKLIMEIDRAAQRHNLRKKFISGDWSANIVKIESFTR